jgi:hypothetical protein
MLPGSPLTSPVKQSNRQLRSRYPEIKRKAHRMFVAGLRKRTISWILGIGAAAGCLVPPHALACPGPDFDQRIFFSDVPKLEGGDVIVRATIISTTRDTERRDGASFEGMARVLSIIKGQVPDTSIKVVVAGPRSSCHRRFKRGDSGILVGRIEQDAAGGRQFLALTESRNQGKSRREAERRPPTRLPNR